MHNEPATARISLPEVNARASTAQHIVTGFSRAMPRLGDLWQQIASSLADILILTSEIARIQAELLITRLDLANLAAAARATISACREGDRDPLWYLRDELEAQGLRRNRGRP